MGTSAAEPYDGDADPALPGNFVVNLTETRTGMLMRTLGSAVANDAPDYDEAKSRNRARAGEGGRSAAPGRFRERSAQTFHRSRRSAGCVTSPPRLREAGMNCSLSHADEGGNASFRDWRDGLFVEPYTAALTEGRGGRCLLDVSDGAPPGNAEAATEVGARFSRGKGGPESASIRAVLDEWAGAAVMRSPRLARAMRVAERAICQTVDGARQLQYLGVPRGPEAEMAGSDRCGVKTMGLREIFAFRGDICDGRAVTCMCWHKVNPRILAVGYSGSGADGNVRDGGAIMFWSLRNRWHPEAIVVTNSKVCSVDFSASRPSLLAAGLNNGCVGLYDSAAAGDVGTRNAVVAESTFLRGGHALPVWMVRWVGEGRYERVISVSADGRVLQWSYQKGLALTPLMTLMRVGGGDGGTNVGAISRIVAGEEVSQRVIFPFAYRSSSMNLTQYYRNSLLHLMSQVRASDSPQTTRPTTS